MGRVHNKVVMDAPVLHYFKNPPTKTWVETRMISLLSSKQEKSNQKLQSEHSVRPFVAHHPKITQFPHYLQHNFVSGIETRFWSIKIAF